MGLWKPLLKGPFDRPVRGVGGILGVVLIRVPELPGNQGKNQGEDR